MLSGTSAMMEGFFGPIVDVILEKITIELQRFDTPTQVRLCH